MNYRFCDRIKPCSDFIDDCLSEVLLIYSSLNMTCLKSAYARSDEDFASLYKKIYSIVDVKNRCYKSSVVDFRFIATIFEIFSDFQDLISFGSNYFDRSSKPFLILDSLIDELVSLMRSSKYDYSIWKIADMISSNAPHDSDEEVVYRGPIIANFGDGDIVIPLENS